VEVEALSVLAADPLSEPPLSEAVELLSELLFPSWDLAEAEGLAAVGLRLNRIFRTFGAGWREKT
jgi:hypothetical protein